MQKENNYTLKHIILIKTIIYIMHQQFLQHNLVDTYTVRVVPSLS
ncbi:MAG: hypothetical protein RIR98_1569 [Bacteroidota bacterium]